MMKSLLNKKMACLLTLAFSCNAFAIDYTIRGFGTLAIGHTDNDQIDYTTSNRNHANGIGYTSEWDLIQDSKLGVQLDAIFNDKWSANLQVVENRNVHNNFEPEVRWAALKYQATPDLSFRAGRIAVPSYMFSDSVSLNYTFPWLRLPNEIYSKIPAKWQESIDMQFHKRLGSVHFNMGLYWAFPFKRSLGAGTYSESIGAQTIVTSLEYKDWQVNVRHGQNRLKITTPQSNQLFSGYRAAANMLEANNLDDQAARARYLSRQYNEDEQRATYTTVGLMFDNGQFLCILSISYGKRS